MTELINRGFTKKQVKDYMPVSLKDIEVNVVLPFNIYLYFEKNKKMIVYRKKNCKLEAENKKNLELRIDQLYIKNEDKETYYEYMSKQFTEVLNDEHLGEKEKKQKVKKMARNLLEDVFLTDSQEGAKHFEENIHEIVKHLIKSITDQKMSDLYSKLMNLISDNNSTYAHSMNVASYVLMFSFCLGIIDRKKLSNIAIAAILHDIALAKLPTDLVEKYRVGIDLSLKETLTIHSHVTDAEEIIKNRYPDFNPGILKIIMQHHEQPDGKGYPLALELKAIKFSSRVLSIANIFDNTVRRLKLNSSKPTPKIAFKQMLNQWETNNQVFDRDMFYKIATVIGIDLDN